MGRPRKKDPVVVKVAEALNMTLAADVMSLDDLAGFPDLKGASARDQVIICACACGIGQAFVAKAMGISQQRVCEIVNTIDPGGMFRLSPDAKKAFVTQLYESRGMEALCSITPEKLVCSSAVELSRIAKTMADASASLNQSKHKGIVSSRVDMLMASIEEERLDSLEVEEAEFEEIVEDTPKEK
ncbi:MAG: hypothetical protein ACYTFK_12560 [Planctomycetota bacterium]|jgi:hypothetical protein